MKERQKGNWDEQTYSDGWNQTKLKFNMEKATNKMHLKNIEKERQQRQQVPGQVGNIKRHTREQKLQVSHKNVKKQAADETTDN